MLSNFYSKNLIPRFHCSTESSYGHIFLWVHIRQNWEEEEYHSCQHSYAHVSTLCLLLHFIPHPD